MRCDGSPVGAGNGQGCGRAWGAGTGAHDQKRARWASALLHATPSSDVLVIGLLVGGLNNGLETGFAGAATGVQTVMPSMLLPSSLPCARQINEVHPAVLRQIRHGRPGMAPPSMVS